MKLSVPALSQNCLTTLAASGAVMCFLFFYTLLFSRPSSVPPLRGLYSVVAVYSAIDYITAVQTIITTLDRADAAESRKCYWIVTNVISR